jgi:SEC-C motif-containing protein
LAGAGASGTAGKDHKAVGPGNALAYADCCGRWLKTSSNAAEATPPDAESLMRSRYSAFVLEREAYLLSSWSASHRPESIAFEPGVKWLGLEVRAHRQSSATTAEVEFVARQKPLQGPAVRLHERSRFVCEQGRWLYVDGDAL